MVILLILCVWLSPSTHCVNSVVIISLFFPRKTMIDWEILDEVQSMLQNFQHRLNQLEKLDSEGKSQQLELQIQKLERRVQELEKSQNDVSQSPVYRGNYNPFFNCQLQTKTIILFFLHMQMN